MNRFDLEQSLMDCWHVVDDLRTISEHSGDQKELLSSVADLYDMKFNKMFKVFEQCIRNEEL